jgi:hypothetical protein
LTKYRSPVVLLPSWVPARNIRTRVTSAAIDSRNGAVMHATRPACTIVVVEVVVGRSVVGYVVCWIVEERVNMLAV